MASFFEQALLRLKEQLQLQADKEVASVIGLSPTAFNDRKKRDAFPEDKLLALSVKRPDLKLDVTYILTGERVSDWESDALAQAAKTISKIERDPNGPLHQSHNQAVKAAGKQKAVRRPEFARLEQALVSCNEEDCALVMEVALTLASRLALGRASVKPAVAVKKAAKKTA